MAIPRVRSAFILGVLAGCAQTPMKVDHALVDAKEERLIVLEERLEKQASQLEKLKAAYLSVTQRLRARKAKTSPRKNAAVVSKQTSVPTKPLLLEPDTEPQTEPEVEGEPVADSRFEVMQLYFEGMRVMDLRDYEKASHIFARFVAENPDHVYADRAQALLAQAYALNKDYGLAVQAANVLEDKYPNSLKLADAMLLKSKAYTEMGQKASAQATLRELFRRFPEARTN